MEKEISYSVLINHEEQFSIWPSYKSIPHGWESVEFSGSKEECLSWINENWSDLRPKSLRDAL